MTSLSKCNLDFADRIKDLTGVVIEESKRNVFIRLNEEDDDEPEETHLSLWLMGGDRPFIEVKAVNETQGLILLTIKICDKGIEGRLDASPSESVITGIAKDALMVPGEYYVDYIKTEPIKTASKITGACLRVVGSETLVTVNGNGKHDSNFQLLRKICVGGTEKQTSPNSAQVEQNVEDE